MTRQRWLFVPFLRALGCTDITTNLATGRANKNMCVGLLLPYCQLGGGLYAVQ